MDQKYEKDELSIGSETGQNTEGEQSKKPTKVNSKIKKTLSRMR